MQRVDYKLLIDQALSSESSELDLFAPESRKASRVAQSALSYSTGAACAPAPEPAWLSQVDLITVPVADELGCSGLEFSCEGDLGLSAEAMALLRGVMPPEPHSVGDMFANSQPPLLQARSTGSMAAEMLIAAQLVEPLDAEEKDHLIRNLARAGGTPLDAEVLAAHDPEINLAVDRHADDLAEEWKLTRLPGETARAAIRREAERLRQERREREERLAAETRLAERAAALAAEQARRALISFSERQSEETRRAALEGYRDTESHHAQNQVLVDLTEDLHESLQLLVEVLITSRHIDTQRLWDILQRLAVGVTWPRAKPLPALAPGAAPKPSQS
jgi:hypothetical protein